MNVYKSINAVQDELSKIGITKSRTNSQGAGYKFRGIDDIFNTISPLLAKHNLCILPRVISRECIERVSKNGGALFYVTVDVEFDFVCAEDGSKHTVKTFGEAMDSGDKATNKAMSAAYKYAALQAFAIPTEGDNDTENQTHEVAPKITPPKISVKMEEAPVGCSPQQISSINSLVDQTQSDIAKICAFFKKPSIALLDRLQANQAIEMLQKKLFDQELEHRSLNSIGDE